MGVVRNTAPVWLISAICYQDEAVCQIACDRLQDRWGAFSARTDAFPFTHTDYYEQEMGVNLWKFFCGFSQPIDPMQVVEAKLFSNHIEQETALNGCRTVNIDPGYLEAAKLVLATTKNFSHRICIGKGIYGDVQLFWRGGKFQCNPWTYPDYQDSISINFFTQLRKAYLLKEANSGDHLSISRREP